MKSTTVSFVNFGDIAAKLQLTEDERVAITDYGFDNVSWGDADYTLIDNNYAVECIVSGLLAYYDESNYHAEDRSVPNRILTEEEVRTKFWEVVEQWDYVNLES